MEASTILGIGGIAVVAVFGIYVVKSSRKRSQKRSVTKRQEQTLLDENANHTKQEPVPKQPPKQVAPVVPSKPLNLMAAKQAFLNNVTPFIPKLNTLCDGTYNSSDWTEEIIGINNEDLTGLWKKIHKDGKAILRILSSWGLKPEQCSSFVGLEYHNELYAKADGGLIEIGKNYSVVKPCWILTENDTNGKTVKRVLTKGEVV